MACPWQMGRPDVPQGPVVGPMKKTVRPDNRSSFFKKRGNDAVEIPNKEDKLNQWRYKRSQKYELDTNGHYSSANPGVDYMKGSTNMIANTPCMSIEARANSTRVQTTTQ